MRSRSPSWRDAGAWTRCGFTRFSTAATSRRRAPRASFARSSKDCSGSARAPSHRSTGRYYAMDRDRRWDRTQRAYEVIAGAGDGTAADADRLHRGAVRRRGHRRVRAPGVDPARRAGASASRTATRSSSSTSARIALVSCATRSSTRTSRGSHVRGCSATSTLVTFTEYERDLDARVAFPREDVRHTLAEEVSAAGLRQFHVAETEKYAHVTYFINGGRETAFDGEERVLVPSPRVATYDTVPEMSAAGVTDAVIARLEAWRRRADHRQLRQRRHGRAHRRFRRDGARRRVHRRVPRPPGARCRRVHRGSARSPPITATRSTRSIAATDRCSPRTRPAPCR